MNNDLKTMTEEWMALERKTLEQRQKAEAFYEDKLMSLITEDYIDRNSDLVYEEVKYLVVSVGTSYEPIVLNIKLLNPEKILFLYTDTSAETMNKIVEMCELVPTEYEKSRVSEVDPLDIYREIKRCFLEWNRPEKMYIDFTGGTKAMSAAAALAGAMIEVQLIYVGTNDYLPFFRKPNPGSEVLFFIDNPLAVFGDLEIEKALTLFGEFNYSGAKEKLSELKESIPDPNIRSQLNFVYLLAECYEAWDSLDFSNAYQRIKELNSQLNRDRRHKNFLLMSDRSHLSEQEKILENLSVIPDYLKEKNSVEILRNDAVMYSLMFTMYQNAITRENQEKYDMATLLFYRLLEMIEQKCLLGHGLYVADMNYETVIVNETVVPEFAGLEGNDRVRLLKSKVLEIRRALFGRRANDYLQDQVSLLDGFVLLLAVGDEIMRGDNDAAGINLLKRIRAMVYLRNNSIFAHGLGPVGYDEYRKFSAFVTELFKKFCSIKKVDFQKMCSTVEWVNPLSSDSSLLRSVREAREKVE